MGRFSTDLFAAAATAGLYWYFNGKRYKRNLRRRAIEAAGPAMAYIYKKRRLNDGRAYMTPGSSRMSRARSISPKRRTARRVLFRRPRRPGMASRLMKNRLRKKRYQSRKKKSLVRSFQVSMFPKGKSVRYDSKNKSFRQKGWVAQAEIDLTASAKYSVALYHTLSPYNVIQCVAAAIMREGIYKAYGINMNKDDDGVAINATGDTNSQGVYIEYCTRNITTHTVSVSTTYDSIAIAPFSTVYGTLATIFNTFIQTQSGGGSANNLTEPYSVRFYLTDNGSNTQHREQLEIVFNTLNLDINAYSQIRIQNISPSASTTVGTDEQFNALNVGARPICGKKFCTGDVPKFKNNDFAGLTTVRYGSGMQSNSYVTATDSPSITFDSSVFANCYRQAGFYIDPGHIKMSTVNVKKRIQLMKFLYGYRLTTDNSGSTLAIKTPYHGELFFFNHVISQSVANEVVILGCKREKIEVKCNWSNNYSCIGTVNASFTY